jgi:transcriptional regulator with XRE-family HTH domain
MRELPGQDRPRPVRFGVHLKDLMDARGISQRRLGGRLGLPASRVAKWCAGTGEPPLCLLVPLAEALGITLEELLGPCTDPTGPTHEDDSGTLE